MDQTTTVNIVQSLEYQREAYCSSSSGFDLRPFLYPTNFKHQFDKIDALVSQVQARHAESKNEEKNQVD
jgi:hypothetical protein